MGWRHAPYEIIWSSYKGISQKLLGGGHYLCRKVHNFFEQNFGRVTTFLPKLREGHNFFIAKPANLNICLSNCPPTNWSFCVNSTRSLVQSIPNTVYIIFEIICVSIYLQLLRKSHIFNSIWYAVN